MYMYRVILSGAHARCADSASCGCRGRTERRAVVKRGAGRAYVSCAGVGACACDWISDSMVAGWAGGSWDVMVRDEGERW